MSSIIEGYNYDIFISYRQKDNKHDGWVTEFVDNLKGELESTFKEEISVYFDINPHNGLLETHDVDASLKEKLKCLVFIPIISRTYCDPKSFAWEHEFKAFVEKASHDQFGLKVKLPNGNVASRVLPVRIHDLDNTDIKLCESRLGGVLRGIDFIYREPGIDRPLTTKDNEEKNLNKTNYRNQINKVALAIREIITSITQYSPQHEEVEKEAFIPVFIPQKNRKTRIIAVSVIALTLVVLGIFLTPKLFKPKEQPEKTIAVLPFRNNSPDSTNQYFIDGTMEAILDNLCKIADLTVISRTSVEQFRNTTKPIREIAKRLNVNYILEGSGQKYGNDIRLTVQLIGAVNDKHIWSSPYEGVADNIFKLQSQISEAIASELKAIITPQEKQLIQKKPTGSLEAYDAYLQGISYWRKFTQHDSGVALQYFEQAIEKDPKFALAYVGISNIWIQRGNYSFASPAEANPKAMAALTKALELDSTRAEVYYALAGIKTYIEWDWIGAESSFKKALVINPNYADALSGYSCLLIIKGQMKEAIDLNELALKLDPLNLMSKALYGLTLLFARRYDDAITTFQEVLRMDPANGIALGNLPEAFHQVGKYKEEFEAWKSYFSNFFKDFVHVFDLGYAKTGYTGAMNREADTLMAQSKTKYIDPWEMACIYACTGNKERAIGVLESAYEVHSLNMPFLSYPIFDNLRNEPSFQALCKKMNLPHKLIE